MNLLQRFWSWLSGPNTQPEMVRETRCGNGSCEACAPAVEVEEIAPTISNPAVTEFYRNDEGYAAAVYAQEDDTLVTKSIIEKAANKPRKAPVKKAAAAITAPKTKKAPPAKKPPKKKK